jgi:hypothetical protein
MFGQWGKNGGWTMAGDPAEASVLFTQAKIPTITKTHTKSVIEKSRWSGESG